MLKQIIKELVEGYRNTGWSLTKSVLRQELVDDWEVAPDEADAMVNKGEMVDLCCKKFEQHLKTLKEDEILDDYLEMMEGDELEPKVSEYLKSKGKLKN